MDSTAAFNRIDLVVIALLLFFLVSGWRKSLTRSLFGPLGLGVSFIVAAITYDLNGNLLTSAAVLIAGAILLPLLGNLLFLSGRASLEKEYRDYAPALNRLLGAAISVLWKGAIMFLIMICLAMAPGRMLGLGSLQNKITQSLSFHFASRYLVRYVPLSETLIDTLQIFQNPSEMQALSQTPAFKTLRADPKVQAVLSNKRLMKDIKEHRIAALISDRRIQALLMDKKLLPQIIHLGHQIYHQPPARQTAAAE